MGLGGIVVWLYLFTRLSGVLEKLSSYLLSPLAIPLGLLLLPACGEKGGMRGIQLSQYFLQHRISLLQHFIIPKPYYPKSIRLQKSGSLGIACNLLRMLPAIQFHDQLLLDTNEINDIRGNGMLSPKLEPAEVAVFQMQPQPPFRLG